LIQLKICIFQVYSLSFDPDQDYDEEGGQAEEEGGQEHEQDAGVLLVQLFRGDKLSAIGIYKPVTLILHKYKYEFLSNNHSINTSNSGHVTNSVIVILKKSMKLFIIFSSKLQLFSLSKLYLLDNGHQFTSGLDIKFPCVNLNKVVLALCIAFLSAF
jgi:hypothetical protein